MNRVINILKTLLILSIIISLISTYIEFEVAKRAFNFSNKILLNGEYLKFYKTIEEVQVNHVNSTSYVFGVFKIKLIIEFSIVIMLFSLLILKKISSRLEHK